MAMIVSEVVIDRAPQVVFDRLSDPRSELSWNPKVRMMEKVTDGPVDVGARFRAKWSKSPVVELEVTRFDRPHGWTWHNGGPISVDLAIELTPEGSSTRLVSRFDARASGPMRLIFPIMRVALRREERRNMALIKAHLESR